MKLTIAACLLAMSAWSCSNSAEKSADANDSVLSTNPSMTTEFSITDEEPEASKDTVITKAILNEDSECRDVLLSVYQYFDVTSDKTYLEKLTSIYSSTTQSQVDQRRGLSYGVSVPDLASGDFGMSKSKVNSVASKYQGRTDYTLSRNELLTLSETYSRAGDVLSAHEKWLACIQEKNRTSRLKIDVNSDDEVQVSVQMIPNLYGVDRVRVRSVNSSANLELVRGDIKARDMISFTGKYTLTYRRKDKKNAFVSINLERGDNIIPAYIPGTAEPKYETRQINEKYIATAKFDISANWLKISAPGMNEATIRFKNQNGSHYTLPITVRTNLKSPTKITNFYYVPRTGGVNSFKWPGRETTITPDGSIALKCQLVSGAKKMTGQFHIEYTRDTLVCVANCPQ
jgi:hypothetical protein